MEDIKVGDWVQWAPMESEHLGLLGPGPFLVLGTHRLWLYVDGNHPTAGFFRRRFVLDPFLTAVHKRRNPDAGTE